MERKDGTQVTKTTVKVWQPLVAKLEARMNEACLRRDLYLTRLLTHEIEHLDAEVGIANSQAAYDHVFERLDELKRKPMSLALPPTLVEKINAVCIRKRIVRDAFFNRVFLLLVASPKNVDALLFPGYVVDWRRGVWHQYGDDSHTVELGVQPLAAVTDPFWAMRTAFEMEHPNVDLRDRVDPDTGTRVKMIEVQPGDWTLPENIYTKYFDQKAGGHDLNGLNCHVPDWRLSPRRADLPPADPLDALLG